MTPLLPWNAKDGKPFEVVNRSGVTRRGESPTPPFAVNGHDHLTVAALFLVMVNWHPHSASHFRNVALSIDLFPSLSPHLFLNTCTRASIG